MPLTTTARLQGERQQHQRDDGATDVFYGKRQALVLGRAATTPTTASSGVEYKNDLTL